MDEILLLRIMIRERVEVLNYFSRYQIPFSVEAYTILADELRTMRIELADLEHKQSVFNYNLINSN
jgi:hypothetical protein